MIEVDSSKLVSLAREDGIAIGGTLLPVPVPDKLEGKVVDGGIVGSKFGVNPSSTSTNPPIRARCFLGKVFDGAYWPAGASLLRL